MACPSPDLTSLADDLERARVSRLLPKVTCPSPFHPCSRTVSIPVLLDIPVTEAEEGGLTALAPLAGKVPPPSDPTSGGRKSGKPIAQANIQLELPEFDPTNLPQWQRNLLNFFYRLANLTWM